MQPLEILRAIARLDGSESLDPPWLSPGDRWATVEEIASSVQLATRDIILGMSMIREAKTTDA